MFRLTKHISQTTSLLTLNSFSTRLASAFSKTVVMSSNFELQYEAVCNGKVPVSKYRSKESGLTVVVAQIDGPIVNGYICLATEAFDDDGLPHTLEHLVFLGSEDFPYKGILDQFANRCLASGTNAWTETDHTCYTMTHAGTDGFLKLLPIYMDHILYPTITESGYVTEVHNVDGAGQDGGIVYCEMQARENTGDSRTHLALLRNMYPGHCGYKSETGGMLGNLRDSTSHEKVKRYHKDFYRPENCCVIIAGNVKPEEVFGVLDSVEKKIMAKGPRPDFTRPWQDAVPPLTETVRQTVRFPSEDEEYGMTHIGFRGPPSKNLYDHLCVSILTDYLDTSAIAPVQRDMVEIEEPFAGSADFNIIENSVCTVYVTFENADVEKQKDIEDEFMKVLNKIASGEEAFDMDRMSSIIHRRKLDTLSSLEYVPMESIAFYAIGHFLYGDDEKDLHGRLNTVEFCERMQGETSQYWTNLLKKIFIGTPRVVITGVPSIDLGAEMGKEEEERTEKQKEELGEEGLAANKRRLEAAEAENNRPPPESVHQQITPPSVSSISLHTISPSSNDSSSTNSDSNPKFPLSQFPFKFMLDDISTNFVELNVLINTSSVPQELKDYLPLYCDLLSESAVMGEDGVLVPFEEMVALIEKDTLSCGAGLGVPGSTNFRCGAFPQLFTLTVRVEDAKYNTAISLAKTLMQRVTFTKERVKVVAKKFLSETASAKRSGSKAMRCIIRQLCYKEESNLRVMNMLRQETFLKDIEKRLKKSPDSVLSALNSLRAVLTQPANVSVHLACDVSKVASQCDIVKPWGDFLTGLKETSPSTPVLPSTHSLLRELDSVKTRFCIVGMKEVESSYMVQAVPCLKDFQHPDLPALMVLLQYLSQCEGPMWKRIRGGGLSYGYSVTVDPECGLLFLNLTKANNIQDPYREAKNIVSEYISGAEKFNQLELDAAKSSLVFELVEEQKTVLKASEQSLLTYFQGVPHEYNKEMLEKVWKVTQEDMQRCLTTHLAPLFDPALVRTVICVNPTKVKVTQEQFVEFHGITLTEVALNDKAIANLG